MTSNLDDKRVILGLSGGVDSTAAALLLREKGYEVIGLYFNVLNASCVNFEQNLCLARSKAERAAEQLGIRLIYRDLSEDFERIVIKNFCDEYMNGRTPNPCIICNPYIKFKALIDTADEEGAKWISTGHYAGTIYDDPSDTWYITKSKNVKKDQSYMLYRLNQEVIGRLILPLNEASNKDEIREIAREKGLDNSEYKDSQEICFIDAEDDHVSFMKRLGISSSKGVFLNENDEIVGEHSGIINYTIGQRKGLGIALGKPVFVTKIDATSNTVKLASNEDLFKKKVCFRDAVYAYEDLVGGTRDICGSGERNAGIDVFAKLRHTPRIAKGKLYPEAKGSGYVIFDEPQRAPTPGQSIVFYVGDRVIGGGLII